MEIEVGEFKKRLDQGGKVDEWARMLYETVHGRMRGLGDEVMILPTHAASVMERDEAGLVRFTLGEARRSLRHFSLTDESAFVAHVKATLLENPERYQEIRKVNLGQIAPDEARLQELEIGKNLCGMAEQKEG